MIFRSFLRYTILITLPVSLNSCDKLVSIPEPVNTITTSETFSTPANATSAILGIYDQMNISPYFGSMISQYAGLSSDELVNFDPNYTILTEFQTNTIQASMASSTCGDYFWNPMYSAIYKANAAIEGLAASKTLSTAVKNGLTGEAKFIRAFCHFYLINLFGDVPLLTTTAWASTSLLPKTASDKIYEQIISDLKDAKQLLSDDYNFSKGERTRANKWVASAFLARVYLYTGDWKNAELESSAVIGASSLYNLSQDLNTVFLKNSDEAIWQLEVIDQDPWATNDGNQFIVPDVTYSPVFFLPDTFLSNIEPGDQRRVDWVDSVIYDDGTNITTYFFPYKYKIRQGSPGDIQEYYMVLRLAEQYLIRAEARANLNNLSEALSDLNIIRDRAHLDTLSAGLSQDQVLDAVAQERKIELFTEWGHRWLDLKRTGKADAVLSLLKPAWQGYQKLYPIPITEIQTDPNLKQNEGY